MTETDSATTDVTFRRYKDHEHGHEPWDELVVHAGESDLCPVYVHRAPPCQGSCPSGHDIRGWLAMGRGQDLDPADGPWQEQAFRRMTTANPFPAIMGRVCPAPCQEGCNRNEVDDFVGINAFEQYVGDWALEHDLPLAAPGPDTGKRVAIVGGGPAGLAAAYFLRLKGHACTIFEEHDALGGMMVFGIPGYRTPRDVLEGEVKRILDMGVGVRLNTRVGTDVPMAKIEQDFDAVFWGIGAQSGKPLPVPGADAPNCVSGISFLRAFNQGRLRHVSGRVLVVGGGDTAMDVAAVARRIGNVDLPEDAPEDARPEAVIMGKTTQDVALSAKRRGAADVWIVYRRPISKAPASQHEIESVIAEGVEIHDELAPLELVLDASGRAKALRVQRVDWIDGKMHPREGEIIDIEAGLVVGATGQAGDFTGIESLDNGRGLMNANGLYQVPGHPGHFVGGDAINPHLLTTAIGHARVAAEGIDAYVSGQEAAKRPKVDAFHFNLLSALHDGGLIEDTYDHEQIRGTNEARFAVHNYEDRSFAEIVPHRSLFLAHFDREAREQRQEATISGDQVLGNFTERFSGLSEEQAVHEGNRCMSCGMCFECDNCIIYCPQDAVYRVPKDQRAMGRYVDTDYARCVGCHICADVCPTGYIQMGLGG
ncbi:MAG: NAD(P)-binding protein [Rhodobacterales bacterium]|nr:NAD(P)-binding protein [Rhodobacterales bacterium]